MPVDRYLNSTNYEHPQESNLLDLHKAMEYDVFGQPILRTTLGPTVSDAFGRFRISEPFTLFDSSHRYFDNTKFLTYTTGTGSTSTFEAGASAVLMTVNTDSEAAVYRETSKIFAYQPGKSLLILNTFCMGPGQPGLVQRAGYFDIDNGIYLEKDGTDVYLVKRSSVSGVKVETRVNKNEWNITPLDGTGADKIELNLDTVQIFFIEIEWLGVGSVRCGFVINGKFIPVHSFHHANQLGNTTTYMTSASLPIRYEIYNSTATTSTSFLRSICSTVISEGGYEIRGRPKSVGSAMAGYLLSGNQAVIYPVLSLRLKSNRFGSIVVPKNFTISVADAALYKFQILTRAITVGGSWISAGDDSAVEYNLTAATLTTGIVAEVGFIASSNQSASAPSLADFPFALQLERDTFKNLPYELVITMQHNGTNLKGWTSINWEELN